MANYIKQWWDGVKAKADANNVARLNDSFYLKEKNGNVYIMHDGVAIFKVPPFASSEETVAYLEESRGYAIECAYGIKYEPKRGARHIWGNPQFKPDSEMLNDTISFFNERVDL